MAVPTAQLIEQWQAWLWVGVQYMQETSQIDPRLDAC
jgi:hypothetical protein